VAEQQPDLLKLAASGTTELGAGAAEVEGDGTWVRPNKNE
jgi:hypothetical protein